MFGELFNTVQNEEIEYPKANFVDIIRYYALLSSNPCEVTDPPEGLMISPEPVKTLIIYDEHPEKNNGVYSAFPFSHFKLKGVVIGGEFISFYGESLSKSLDTVDKILLVSGNVLKKYQTKVITCQFDPSLKGFNYKFGKKNKNKRIIVTTPSKGRGLLSQLSASTVWTKYAEQMNIIHFVDFQNFPNSYTCPKYLGRYNAWNYYFKQPDSISVDEVYDSADVTIIRNDNAPPIPIKLGKVDRSLLSDQVLEREDAYFKNYFGDKSILGVALRGTDYFTEKWHRIPTDAHESLEICIAHMHNLNCDYIYLSTEDIDNYNYFKEKMGDKIIAQDRIRFNHTDLLTKVERSMGNFDSLNVGMGYILDILMVSRTKAAIVSSTSSVKYIKDFGDSLKYCDVCLSKNYNGALGRSPLVIKSHSKNHLEFVPPLNTNISCIKSRDCWKIVGQVTSDAPLLLSESKIHLIPEKDYFFSVNVSPEVDGEIKLILVDTKKSIVMIKEGQFTAPFGVELAQVIYVPTKMGALSFELSCQIEVGWAKTEYEPPYCSETQIGLMDVNGLIYKSKYVNAINFHSGYFEVDYKRIKLNITELKRANNVITYPGGYITYNINGQEYDTLADINHCCTNNDLQVFDLSIFDEPVITKFLLMPHILNTIKAMLASNNSVLYELALIKIQKYCDVGGIIYLAKSFRDGLGVLKNLQISASLLRLASEKNSDAKNLLFDVLWNIHSEDSLNEMIDIGRELVSIDDPGGLVRMGKAYRSGVGVERNLDIALEYFREATMLGSQWGKEVLIDLLKSINTPKAKKELLTIV